MKKAVVIVLVLAALVCATSVMAQGPNAGRRSSGMMGMSCPAMAVMPPMPMFIDRAEALNLSAETKDKLKAILTKGDETLQPLRQKSAEASRLLREAVLADDFSEAKVKQLVADAQKAEQAVIDAEITIWREIRQALSADQFKAMRDMMGAGMRGSGRPGGNRSGAGAQPAPPPQPPSE